MLVIDPSDSSSRVSVISRFALMLLDVVDLQGELRLPAVEHHRKRAQALWDVLVKVHDFLKGVRGDRDWHTAETGPLLTFGRVAVALSVELERLHLLMPQLACAECDRRLAPPTVYTQRLVSHYLTGSSLPLFDAVE